jgi:two-component system, NtrC family, nitrogen regulation sensor histidine kinase NtrY
METMVLNKLFINVLIRVIFIVLFSMLLGIILPHIDRGYYYTLTGIILLIMLQAWSLVNQVNQTNDDLEKFFSSVEDQDSSVRLPEGTKNSSFGKLHERMNQLNTIIQHVKIENERTGQFLKSVVDHVDIGLVSFDRNGQIGIYNRAAKKYLNFLDLRHLSLLKMKDQEMGRIINTIKPGEEILHKMVIDNLVQSILVRATEIKFESNVIKLLSFQNITNELEKKELDSWQRLIRVLTHEIMNSISPITSLTSVISGYYKNKNTDNPVLPEEINSQTISRTLSGLNTIEETGKGLLDFVDKYRSLTSLPKPNVCRFKIEDLFRKCEILMGSNIPKNIKITTHAKPDDISLEADYAQVEQVLINLVKNSSEALYGKINGFINLKAIYDNGNVIIQVEDNGPGIPSDIIDDIFIPFYTTKENGSGIGLSLSRQIMRNHNGTISVSSALDKGTVFTLKF